jgi:hypothetical protein
MGVWLGLLHEGIKLELGIWQKIGENNILTWKGGSDSRLDKDAQCGAAQFIHFGKCCYGKPIKKDETVCVERKGSVQNSYLEDLSVARLVLKLILKKADVNVWDTCRFIWLRTGKSGRILNTAKSFQILWKAWKFLRSWRIIN